MPKSDKLQNVYDKRAYCPFWKGTEHSQVIRCEGPVAGTIVRIGFPGKKKFAAYLDAYCTSQACEKCRMYQCAMRKYEEEG